MTDRIYVTYTPTTAPGAFHTAIHYERTDAAGNIIEHHVIEAKPRNLKDLSAQDKAMGVVEETFRSDNGPSRFGRVDATAIQTRNYDPGAPYENLAEGDDLSENLGRMRRFTDEFNNAGYAYRGDRPFRGSPFSFQGGSFCFGRRVQND